MSPAPTHLSAFTIDALVMKALSNDEAAQANAHLAGCDRCQKDAETARIARERFTDSVFARTLTKLHAHSRGDWLRLPVLKFALAPAFAATILLLVFLPKNREVSDQQSIGIKGGAAFQVFARRSGRVFPVADKARLAPGDEIRFAVTPAGFAFVLVVSVDGAGKANIYFPFDGAESGRIAPSSRTELPGSVVLDAAPGPERVFALFSRRPISVTDTRDALRKLGAQGASAIRAGQQLPVSSDAQLTLVFEKSP